MLEIGGESGMDMNSFGEDLVVKVRKPYTIKKQREKWTEEEHNRFLEALKLYGRAWQRIEDHIGTKSAIQIRSHAQKFFTKLEKEAVVTGGASLGRAHDIIDIPPPRPKKKPNYPYPRKSGLSSTAPATEAGEKSLRPINPLPQQIINKQEVSAAAESLQETTECSAILNLFQDTPSASMISSMDNSSKNQLLGFREYVPVPPPPPSSSSLTASSLTMEAARGGMESAFNGLTNSDETIGWTSGLNMGRHSLSACSGKNNHKTAVENGVSPSSANPLLNHITPAAMSSPPLPQSLTTPDFDRSSHGMQAAFSSFSSELVSTLQQNPAVHAAACMAAASLWPSEEMCSPSMAAIVAATVAAASAWWSMNGLIPFPPIHAPAGFQFSSPAASVPVVNSVEAEEEKMEEASAADQQTNGSSSSDGAGNNLDGTKIEKRDRSSCGSNTTSSSEIETDAAALMKNNESKDEVEGELSQNLPAGEANIRRARTNFFLNETWKEVSHQGRVAFQELFSRDSLPQSFPFATQLDNLEMVGIKVPKYCPSGLAEEMMTCGSDQISNQNSSRSTNEIKHGSLKVRRTGFKPYKRCSAEVEVRKISSANDGISNKKIRVEGEFPS